MLRKLNDTLIIQAGENEIVIQQQAERIRDLEAALAEAKGLLQATQDAIIYPTEEAAANGSYSMPVELSQKIMVFLYNHKEEK